ncbi:MAG: DUF6455 family protein [Ruegeria sp.]
MSSRESLRKHADLVDRMATSLGVDLQEEAIAGVISVDEITDAVLRCTDCPNPDHCVNALANQAVGGKPPEYCRNQDLLKKLVP